jgi:hypothetical protein
VTTNGTGDSTAGIQQAIDDAFALNKTVLFPPGTYQISDSLKCYNWQLWDPLRDRSDTINAVLECNTLWGSASATNRPVIKLAASASHFDDTNHPRPLISFRNFAAANSNAVAKVLPADPLPTDALGTPENFTDAAASLFCNELRGIDFDCNGHAGAFGVFFRAAQGSAIVDVRVDATDAYAGIWGVPGRNSGGMNIEVEGGKTGLILDGSIAGTVLTGVNLFNQTGAAFSMGDFVPTTLVGFHIVKDSGPVVTFFRNIQADALSLIDGIVELHTNSAVLNNSAGMNLYVSGLYVTGSDQIIQNPSGTVSAIGTWKRVREYVYTDQSNPSGDPPYEVDDQVFRIFNMIDGVTNRTAEPSTAIESNSAEPPADLVSRHIYANLPLYEGLPDGTINITDSPYNATADDDTDDRAAIQAAIDAAATNGIGRVFMPAGTFRIGDTLTLQANTVFFGTGRRKSILTYHDSWQPTTGRVVMVDTVDDASATTFLGFLNISTRCTGGETMPDGTLAYDRFDAVHWHAGRRSCYFGISHDGEWDAAPDNAKHTLEIAGNGGGRFYFFSHQNPGAKTHSDQREVYIEGTREPLWFYGLNSEITKPALTREGASDANVEIVDGQNISILGVKREGISPSIIMRDCRNIAVYSSGALREELFAGSGGYLQILGTSDNILIANVLVQKVWSMTNSEPQLIEALTGGVTNQIMWPDGVSLYKRGEFNPAAGSLAADADEDGTPNEWEQAHGLDPLNPQDAFQDSDGDSLLNWMEYIAGTDPQNADSGLRVQPAVWSGAAGVGFASVSGRIYSVEACSNLLNGDWLILTNSLAGTDNILEYEDTLTKTSRFYRVKVRLP